VKSHQVSPDRAIFVTPVVTPARSGDLQDVKTDLTEAALSALRPPARGRLELNDIRVPELWLRVTTADRRTWSVFARLPDGRQVRPTLGRYPELGLAAARRRAKQVLGDMARGVDPTAQKRIAAEANAATKAAPTVMQRLGEWQTAKAQDWSERYRAELARVVDKMVLPKLGKRILGETARDDWVKLATDRRNKTPASASWLYDACSSFLNYAESAGWVEVNPLPRRSRNHLVPRPQSRERVLSDDELLKVWRASASLSPKSRCFVRLLVLTATRVSEVAGVASGEVNMLAERWTLPPERSKNGRALVVPVSSLAMAELRNVWPQEQVGPSYRLLGAVHGSALQAPLKIKSRLDELSGVRDWRLHDLRRTARTGMAKLGIDDRAAEAALNHLSARPALTRVYDRHDYAGEALTALQAWQEHVAKLIEADRRDGEAVA
jgi:integrase